MEFDKHLGIQSGDIFNYAEKEPNEEDRHDWFEAAAQESEIPEDQITSGAFCFETDHLALKGNSDYNSLIRSLSILEVQRIKSIKVSIAYCKYPQ